jgi:hypothetical protein
MVWAGEAGDRSLMWGGGQRKVADRIVSKMKDQLLRNRAHRRKKTKWYYSARNLSVGSLSPICRH